MLASDKLSCLHKPVLLLKLDLVDTDGVEKEPVILEFSESELDSFVQALGNAHQVSLPSLFPMIDSRWLSGPSMICFVLWIAGVKEDHHMIPYNNK